MASGNLAAAAAFFRAAVSELDEAQKVGLEKAAVIVETASKAAIGDPGNGFGWPPLAQSTLARKAANTPLYETGKLQSSISHVVDGNRATIGTDSLIGVYQMLGTSRGIPPRDFLMPAVMQNKEEIEAVIGRAFAAVLTGRGLSTP